MTRTYAITLVLLAVFWNLWACFPIISEAQDTSASISIACLKNSPPAFFTDNEGKNQGWIVDMWRLWSQKTGIEVIFVPGTWQETLDMVLQETVDVHAGVFYNAEREALFDFANPIWNASMYFFFHKSLLDVNRLDDLLGFRVGVVKGAQAEAYFTEHLPQACLMTYPIFADVLDAAEKKEIRVFANPTGITLWMLKQRGLLDEFRFHSEAPLFKKSILPAVKKGNTHLADIINHGLTLIPSTERAAIEEKWMGASTMRRRDVLIIAGHNNLPPLSFLNTEGEPAGLLVDTWRLWSNKTGTPLEFRLAGWPDTFTSLERGEADIHAGLFLSPNREDTMDFSQPLYGVGVGVFFPLTSGPLERLQDLDGQMVGVPENSHMEEYVRTHYPNVHPVAFHSTEEGLRAAKAGTVRAFVSTIPTTIAILNRLGLSGEFDSTNETLYTRTFHAGIMKGKPELLHRIDQGFNMISNTELADIEQRWIREPDKRYYQQHHQTLRLTSEEQLWLRGHPSVKAGIPLGSAPLSFQHHSRTPQGVLPDYLALLAKHTGLKFEFIPLDQTDLYRQAQTRHIDLYPGTENPNSQSFFHSSNPFFSISWVIIDQGNSSFIRGLHDLREKHIAIIQHTPLYRYIQQQYPEIILHPVENSLESLQLVSMGKVDACISSLVIGGYQIQKHMLTNLKVTAPVTEYPETPVCLAVRNDWPELLSILNKAIQLITPEEREAVLRPWMSVRYEQTVDWTKFWRWAFGLGGIAGTLLLMTLLWNRRLVREIGERKQIEMMLRVSEEKFRRFFESTEIGIALTPFHSHDIEEGTATLDVTNSAMLKILGYSARELRKLPIGKISHPDDLRKDQQLFQEMLEQKHNSYSLEKRYIRKDGTLVWGLQSIALIRDDDERPQYIISSIQDITARKQAEKQLKKTLREKEVLLRELHHRVKNNMQAISSMFRLQARQAHAKNFKDVLKEGELRIKAMGMVHEMLYQAEDFAHVDMEKYIRKLTKGLLHSFNLPARGIQIIVETESLFLGVDKAIPCGLMVNELVTNSMKYGFPNGMTGEIRVCLSVSAGEISLDISDTGIGLPPGIQITHPKTIGFTLVQRWIQQMLGTMTLVPSEGTHFHITFPKDETPE